ncbi:MAG TPA: M20 family metallopeptidase [Candidatus Acidoferrales bacterium]|nr:M20 family metallopeptidase [Candidatus Acidoferrales bacterium]
MILVKATTISMRDLLNWMSDHETSILRLMKTMVEIESPTDNKAAVDELGAMVAKEWNHRGARVRLLRQRERGNHIGADLWLGRGRPSGQIMILGHLDTVYPLGTLRKMPFLIANGRAWGPGTFDMKGGLTIALAAVDALRAFGIRPRKKFTFLWTSDEETGSHSSRRAIENTARESDAVFVLEPSFGLDGRFKTQRKGVGEAQLTVTGRSAHAGIDPERGVNAVHEISLQIARLMELNNPRRGITLQANVVEGGTATNVVPDRACARIDVRATRAEDAAALNRRLHAIRPIMPGAKIEVRGGVNRPPMERSAGSRKLFQLARELAREMGLDLNEASTGGGSDGNFTAALGIPTLDGMGAVGDGAHSPKEHVVIRGLLQHAALLAGLLATI